MKKNIAKLGCLVLCLTALTSCSNKEELMKIREKMSTVGIEIDNEGVKPEVIYTENIHSKTMYCGADINKFEQLDNVDLDSGTFSAGFNPTAFLQPGNNTLELWVASLGAYDGDDSFNEHDMCEATLFAAFEDGKKTELSSLTVTVEEEKVTVKLSKVYPKSHQTPLINTDGVVTRHITDYSRPFYIKTIPRWRWVDATPINKDNPTQMKKLHRAYDNLIALMKAHDFEGLKMAYSLSSREKAKADAYFSKPDDYYLAVGFEDAFNDWSDASVEPRRDWSKYELTSFMGGRLVKLEDSRGHSPLRIGSDKEDLIISQLPYFSMIDGRVVISR